MSTYPEYYWQLSESAPVEYVMQIIDGYFETVDGYQKDIPTRVVLNNGWGMGRSRIVGGPDTLTLPVAMEVTWFSYREDTFYRGEFKLPYDKIVSLFSENREMSYTATPVQSASFVVGVAPGGYVVVWLGSAMHNKVLLTGFAKKVDDVPWEAVFQNTDFSKEEIMKETIDEAFDEAKDSPHLHDPTYWQRLHSELYRYTFIIESNYTPYTMGVRFLNSTSDEYFYDEFEHWRDELHSVPTSISFEFLFPNRIPVVPIDNFDNEELYAAFRHLSQDFDGVLQFVITIEGDLESWGYRPKIRIENDKEAIEIKQFDFRAIDSSDLLKYLDTNKDMQRFVNRKGVPATP